MALSRREKKRYKKLVNKGGGLSNRQQKRLGKLEDKKAGTFTPPGQGPVSPGTEQAIDDARWRDPGSMYGADMSAARDQAEANIGYGNANTTTDFGGTQTTINPDGSVSYSATSTGANKALLEGGQANAMTGTQLATGYLEDPSMANKFNPNLAEREFQGGFSEDRRRVEDAVYQNLTRRFDRDEGRLVEAKEQELHNKGIPYSDDPESRYQKEMRSIQERFDDQRDQAALQATQFGGSEMAQQFGMQEQLRANQYSEQAGTRNQGWQDVFNAQGVGIGYQNPNLPGYQGTQIDVTSPSAYIYGKQDIKDRRTQLDQTQQQIDNENAIAQKQLAMSGGGGGGGAAAPPPFP